MKRLVVAVLVALGCDGAPMRERIARALLGPETILLTRVEDTTYTVPEGLPAATYTVRNGTTTVGTFVIAAPPPDGGAPGCPERTVAPVADPTPAAPLVYVDDSAGSAGDGSLVSPYLSLASAISAAAAGSSVLVAAGTYTGAFSTGTKNLKLFGGYSADFTTRTLGSSILRGTGSSPAVTVLAMSQGSGTQTVVVDGFRLENGVRAIDVSGSSTAWTYLITNNRFEGNGLASSASSARGSALFFRTAKLIFSKNVVNGNIGANGIVNSSTSDWTIVDSTFSGNDGHGDHGGGAFLTGSGQMSCNAWTGNSIGAHVAGSGWGASYVIYNGSSASVLVEDDTATGNLVGAKGTVFVDGVGTVTLRRALVAGNGLVAGRTGVSGLYVDGEGSTGPTVVLDRSTITGNTGNHADGGLGIYATRYSTVNVTNSILWNGASADDLFARSSDGAVINWTYSLSGEDPAAAGSQIIETSPYVVGNPLLNSDYTLGAGSPAIGAGQSGINLGAR